MRFGLFGGAEARRGDGDPARGFQEYVETCAEAEALGLESSFLVEHHFSGLGQVSASLDLLAWAAARTTKLRLGTAVITLPWHDPVLLAERAATLDLMSGGRLEFGVGKGYRHSEFAGFRIPYEEAEGRFEEALQVITTAWTSNVRFSHSGRFWQYEDIIVEPPTSQSRIRQSGSPRANRIRFGASPHVAANCCSTSSHQPKQLASGSRCSEPSARRAAARSTQWTSLSHAISTSPKTLPTRRQR